MFKKKYKTTSKIEYAFIKYRSRRFLAERYVFYDRHNRAVKTFEEAEALSRKAWETVFKLYPSLRGNPLRHSPDFKEILIISELS